MTGGSSERSEQGPEALARRVGSLALALGFDLVGIAPPTLAREADFFRAWLARGYAGEMHYLEQRAAERADPARLLPGVASIICLGLIHDPPQRDAGEGRGRVASYAGGEDYHGLMLDRVRALAAALEPLAGRPVASRCYVDTGPLLERAFAARAGLGWIGKNTCLIHPKLGSRMLLGEVLSDLPLAFGSAEPDHCGSCTACLDACPTDAFAAPYELDATRCIAYSTIEARSSIDPALREAHGDMIFGCDICQDVCPWNRRRAPGDLPDPLGLRERLRATPALRSAELGWLLCLDRDGFLAATRGTALRRARHRGLLRNALVAAGNAGDPALRPQLERHAAGDDAMLAEHARWALGRLAASARS